MTFEEYTRIDAINWSSLKHGRKSMAHYRYHLDHPPEDTTALALGRAAHTAILEPDRFPLEYVCFKGERRAGKAWEDFRAAHPNETILKLDEYQQCLRIRDAVRAHPLARPYFECGVAEQSLLWKDAETGLDCKGRLDWVSATKGAIVDLKTTKELDAGLFGATAARLGYHVQGSWYQAGHHRARGEVLPVVIVAVESAPPHDVAVFQLRDDELYAGEREWQRLIKQVTECRLSNRWPGRYDAEVPLVLPKWAYGEDEAEGDDGIAGLDLVVGGRGA